MDKVRLGDVIDDFCARCRLPTNHSVVAMVGEEVKKVRCRTCNHEHDYRHGEGSQKKKTKASAYEQVLATVLAGKERESAVKPARHSPVPARRRVGPLSPRGKPLRPR